MVITAHEFASHLWKYLDIVAREDVLITRDGEAIAKVSRPKSSAVDSLLGILKDAPQDLDMRSVREERR